MAAAEPSTWEVATAIGQVLAGGSAVIGLVFVGLQIRAARRTADIQTLQEFNRSTIEREFAFLNADNSNRKEQAFVELLNFLEVNAAAFNGRLLPAVSRKIIRDSLANSIAAIQLAPAWAEKFGDLVRTISTFEELGRFMRTERKAINAIVEMMRKRSEG